MPDAAADGLQMDEADLSARIQEVFDRFDKDGGGSLDKQEMMMVFKTLSPSFTSKQINVFIKQLAGSDGEVSHGELMAWIKAGSDEAKEVLAVIVKETGDAMANCVRETFQRFDSDGGGVLDRDELARVFRTLDSNFTMKDIDALVKDVDRGGDGKVSQKEFIAWLKRGSDWAKSVNKALAKETGGARDERIKKAFQKYDATGDGSLDIEELRKTLKVLGSFSNDEVTKVCADLDKSKDGEISYDEFAKWIKSGLGSKEVMKAKAILAPSNSDGLEGVFYNFCGAGHADMDGKSFKKLCIDTELTDKKFNATQVDLIFQDNRVKPKTKKTIDFIQFEVALEILAEKKGHAKADVRNQVLMSGGPKIVATATKAMKFVAPGERPQSGKKPKRTASERRIAAILKAPLNETPGAETWRRDVDNTQLWKVFGLDSKAGQTLKRIYTPNYAPVSPKGRPMSALSANSSVNATFLTKSMSLPDIAKSQGGGARPKLGSTFTSGF